MQDGRTSLALGCTITTVKGPIGVARMWEENRISFIGVGAIGKWANNAFRSRMFWKRWQ
jgi:hypothetical protein